MNRKHSTLSILTRPSQSDRTAILESHNRNFPESKWDKEYIADYFSDRPSRPICVTIENKKRLIGFALGRFPNGKKSEVSLCTLLVSKHCRGKGYGRRLMHAFFQTALERLTMKKVCVHFRDSNKNIKEFYDRFGFANHKICGKYSNGEKKHYMDISRKSIRQYLSKSNIEL